MLDHDESQTVQALALFCAWLVVGIVVSFLIVPPWEVLKAILFGLSPFIVAGLVVLGMVICAWWTERPKAKKTRNSKSTRENEKA